MKTKRKSIVALAVAVVLACAAGLFSVIGVSASDTVTAKPAQFTATDTRENLLEKAMFDVEGYQYYWNFMNQGEVKDNGRDGKYFEYRAASRADTNNGYISTNGYTGNLEKGNEYVIGAWIKFQDVQGAVNFAVQYEGTKINVGNGDWSGYQSVASVSADTDWKYYEFSYTIEGDGGPLKTIYFANAGTGTATICLDDVILYCASGADNLMGDQGSCESAFGWSAGPASAITSTPAVVSDGYEGNAFKLDGTDLALKEYATKIPAGKQYVFSAMVKVEKAEGEFAFSAIRDTSDVEIAADSEAQFQKSEDIVAVTNGWTKLSYVFTQYGDDPNYYMLGFRMLGTGTVYVDNVSITELAETTETPIESMLKDGGMEEEFCVELSGEAVKDNLAKGISYRSGVTAEIVHHASAGSSECTVVITDELTLAGKAKYNFAFDYTVKGNVTISAALVSGDAVYSLSNSVEEPADTSVKLADVVFEMPEITGTVTGNVAIILEFTDVNSVVTLDNFAFDCAHAVFDGVVTKEPTLEAEGEYKYGCVGCGEFDESKTEVIPKLGTEGAYEHKVIKEATCLEAGSESFTHEKFGTFTVVVPKKAHDMTEHAAVPHTCKEDGTLKYYSCSLCGKNYADENGETVLTDVTDPAKHDAVFVETVYHTCTADGNIAHYHCSVCGKNFSDEACTTELADVTDKAAHSLQKTEAKEATAEEDGNIEYYYCSVCKKYFRDANAAEEITLADTVLPKTAGSDDSGCRSELSANMPLWLAVAAIAGAAVIMIKRKRA